MVIRMRHTRAHTRNRRSHHALKETALAVCGKCGAATRPHHMCLACGYYNGRQVLDLGGLKVKRDARIKAKHDRIRLESGSGAQATPVHDHVHEEKKITEAKAEKKPRATRKVPSGGTSEKTKEEA